MKNETKADIRLFIVLAAILLDQYISDIIQSLIGSL